MDLWVVVPHKFSDFAVQVELTSDQSLFHVPLGILKNENGVPEDEENFEEAIKNVNTALNPTKVPDQMHSFIILSLRQHFSSFWTSNQCLTFNS